MPLSDLKFSLPSITLPSKLEVCLSGKKRIFFTRQHFESMHLVLVNIRLGVSKILLNNHEKLWNQTLPGRKDGLLESVRGVFLSGESFLDKFAGLDRWKQRRFGDEKSFNLTQPDRLQGSTECVEILLQVNSATKGNTRTVDSANIDA